MGNFFFRDGQSKTPTNIKSKKKNKPKKAKQEKEKRRAGKDKVAEKKTVHYIRENTQEDTNQTGKEVEKKTTKAAIIREEKRVQKASIKREVMGAGLFSFSAQKDTENYRNGYPGKKDRPGLDNNYKFYMNEISSKPNGLFIDKIHVDWWGNYKLLEDHHGYIQWLFPIRESGVNMHAQELQLHEIKNIQSSEKAMERLLTSYKMMLDFYGMELVNEDDGTIKRADNWRERFRHLNRSGHNYLRITRILKCLGELGYEHLKKNFVKFVLYEGLVEGTLSKLIGSCVKYWIEVLKKDEEREEMFDYYKELAFDKTVSSRPRDKSSLQTESKTGASIVSEQDESGKDKSTKKAYEKNEDKEKLNNEIPDNDVSVLHHSMNYIDNVDEIEKNGDMGEDFTDKQRNEHKLSVSDKEIEIKPDEMHWKNTANLEEINSGSEFHYRNDNAVVQRDEENKITDSAGGKPLSDDKESLVNDKVETCTGSQTHTCEPFPVPGREI